MISVTPHSGRLSEADSISSLAEAPEALPVGSPVGSFVLSGVSSQDEFGICYHATSSASDTQVTIEEYAPAQIARRAGEGVLMPCSPDQADLLADGQRAFLHEAEQFSRLSHPSLLRIGPTWRARGTAYRLRIGGEGRGLAEVLDELPTRPDEPWLRRWLAPLLDALDLVHAGGWVHGNLRPGRVAMREDGTPVLLDSGAVALTLSGRLPAPREWPEPEFLPVELLESSSTLPVGPWSDLYSLAALTVWCQTGRVPEDGADWQRLAAGCGGLRPALEAALHPDPSRRLQSVAEFRAAMKDARHPKEEREAARHPREESEFRPASADAAQVASVKDMLVYVTGHGPAGAKRPPAGLAPLSETREPAWSPAPSPVPQREELAALDDGGAWFSSTSPQGAASRPFGFARPSRHWPWALGGAAAGALLSAALTLFVLKPTAEVHWTPSKALPSLGTVAGTPGVTAPTGPLPAGGPSALARGAEPAARDAAVAAAYPGPARVEPAAPPAGPSAADPAALIAQSTTGAGSPASAGLPSTATPAPLPGAAGAAAPVAAPAIGAPAQAPVMAAAGTAPRTTAEQLLEESAGARARVEPLRAAATTTRAAAERGDDREAVAAARREEAALAENPAAACSPRTNFALYRCMQTQCEQRRFFTHPQCIRLRVRDEVS